MARSKNPKYLGQQTGKIGEYYVVHKLLQEGYDVYTPIVDKEQVDYMLINNNSEERTKCEIEVKTRNWVNNQATIKITGRAIEPRDSYYLVFVFADNNEVKDFVCMHTQTAQNNFGELKAGRVIKFKRDKDNNLYLQHGLGTWYPVYDDLRNNFSTLHKAKP